jgi:multisubunit Na+/H+ antiporter MnhG subunit
MWRRFADTMRTVAMLGRLAAVVIAAAVTVTSLIAGEWVLAAVGAVLTLGVGMNFVAQLSRLRRRPVNRNTVTKQPKPE